MMTSTLTATSGILDNQALRSLAGCNGPCITLVVPAHHPGAQDGSRKALVHRMLRTAREQLTRGKLAGRAAELLAPLEEIVQESGVAAGGAGFAIFCSPEYTARYDLPDKRGDEPAETLGGHVDLTRPLLFLKQVIAPSLSTETTPVPGGGAAAPTPRP